MQVDIGGAPIRNGEMAGVTPRDIDVAEVHDCFSGVELISYEDLGFAERFEAYKPIEGKVTMIAADDAVLDEALALGETCRATSAGVACLEGGDEHAFIACGPGHTGVCAGRGVHVVLHSTVPGAGGGLP